MILYRINLEDDKACIQEVELLVRVQQVVVFATFVVRLQHVEEIGQVNFLMGNVEVPGLQGRLRPASTSRGGPYCYSRNQIIANRSNQEA